MQSILTAPVGELQARAVKAWHREGTVYGESDFASLILTQHRFNYELWHQEDQARRKDVDAGVIAGVKRAIDGLNQQRNDAIERIDDYLIGKIEKHGIRPADKARQNSETPGSIVDRLSILALRIYHMTEETEREDADKVHRQKCRDRLVILTEQRTDLLTCLQELLTDVLSGKKRLKVYRQFKMYNDPALNPAVYGRGLP
ncbi:MAG: DUF4254 domain-containing protein [Fibrobacterota bacterium]